MKAYRVLSKQIQSQIEMKQKDIAKAYQDQNSLEDQIEYLKESLEKEHIASSLHRQFVNPKYFERVGNKIQAYTHLLRGKEEEIEGLQEEVRELFAERKKYDVLVETMITRLRLAKQKEEEEMLADLFRPQANK